MRWSTCIHAERGIGLGFTIFSTSALNQSISNNHKGNRRYSIPETVLGCLYPRFNTTFSPITGSVFSPV